MADKLEEQAQRTIVIRQLLGEKQDLETKSMDILSSWLGLGTLTLMITLKHKLMPILISFQPIMKVRFQHYMEGGVKCHSKKIH